MYAFRATNIQGPKKWFATKEGPRQEQAIFSASVVVPSYGENRGGEGERGRGRDKKQAGGRREMRCLPFSQRAGRMERKVGK